jgi:phosphoribosylanthranilate isomerase
VVRALRGLGDWTLWKGVRANSIDDIRAAVDEYGSHADGLLIEGWREGAVGGAGLHLEVDPDAVRRAIPSDLTFVLAGGLTPESVSRAVARFRPDVVDVSSGVEQEVGTKDHDRIESFVQRARAIAFPQPPFADPGRTR